MNTPIDSNSITSKIIRFSHNPLLILVITGIMLIISYYSIKIFLDAIPDLSDTQVIVYSGIGVLISLKTRLPIRLLLDFLALK